MAELCRSYRRILDKTQVHPLVAASCLVFDFLCIHPFRDGNGRVSRLAMLLTLYSHAYDVGRYVSLERIVEESKEDYYAVLRESSEGWHDCRHDIVPWLNYSLATVRRAYREFERRVGSTKSPRGAKTSLVEAAAASFTGEFTINDVERACPGVSRDMVRKVIRDLQKLGTLECLGRGPGARWQRAATTKEGSARSKARRT